MCDVNGQFKLCTCSEKIDKTKPYWVLNKGTPKNKDNDILIEGTLIYSEDEINREITEDILLQDLNSKNIFDFDYHPLKNDILKLYDGKYTYHFIYSKVESISEWEIFDKGPFSNNKFKLRQKKKGFIKKII